MADKPPAKEHDDYGVVIKQTDNTKGKSLFASKSISKGDLIFQEKPLVCVQFLWNAEYKYRACDHCLRSLESAQEMARRLSGDHNLDLPYTEQCCDASKYQQDIVTCPRCQVEFYFGCRFHHPCPPHIYHHTTTPTTLSNRDPFDRLPHP